MLPQRGRLARVPNAIAWRGCAAISTFLSDFSPAAAPVLASASFLAFAAHPDAPRRRAARAPDMRARWAVLLNEA